MFKPRCSRIKIAALLVASLVAGCGLHSVASIQTTSRAVHAKYYGPSDVTAERVAAAIDPSNGHPTYTWFDRDVKTWIERAPEKPQEAVVLLGRNRDDVVAAVHLLEWEGGTVVETSAATRWVDRHLRRTLEPLLGSTRSNADGGRQDKGE